MLVILGAITLMLPGMFSGLAAQRLIHWPLRRSTAWRWSVAFLLSWAAETAQRDIPRSLALTILTLTPLLSEYAVDMYLALARVAAMIERQ